VTNNHLDLTRGLVTKGNVFMVCHVWYWYSITQQLSGASRGHKAKLMHGKQKLLEWSLPQVLCKTEESAHFKVSVLQSLDALINHCFTYFQSHFQFHVVCLFNVRF